MSNNFSQLIMTEATKKNSFSKSMDAGCILQTVEHSNKGLNARMCPT